MRSPKNLMPIAALAAFLLVLIAIGGAPASWAQERFRVGAVLPLTGPAADYGIAIKNAITLAQQDRADLFTTIDFIYEDASTPATAVSALRNLRENKGVDLAITWGVALCKALAPIAEAQKIPLVGICLDPTVARGRSFVLRFLNTTDEIMRAQAQHLSAHGMKRLGLLLAEDPYLDELRDALERNLVPGQTITIIDELPRNELDLRTTIVKIMKGRGEFDSLGVFLFAGQITSFYRQARDLGLVTPTFGTNFFESLSEVRASNGAMNGAIFASIEIKKGFADRYKALFRNESQLAFGAPAYELALVVGELFSSNGAPSDGEEVMKRFEAIQPREGIAAGPYRFVYDERVGRYFQFPIVVKRVTGESFPVVQ